MNDQYLIISGTNRKDSNTIKVATIYRETLAVHNIDAPILSLEKIDLSSRSTAYVEMEKEWLVPCSKFIVIAPEYNGSIPGVLKTLLDLSDYKKVWWGKKALLTGVSTGRSGNIRGLEHLTTILHYLKVVVHPDKLPISSVHNLLDNQHSLHDEEMLQTINNQLVEFIKF